MFSHKFLLFQLLLTYSSIFAKTLLTNFFTPFLALRESNFLSRFLVPLALQASTSYMCPHISGTEPVGFSKQDARGNLVVDSLLVIFPLSPFRLLPKVSGANVRWAYVNHTLLTHKNPRSDTFLHDISPTELHSTARVKNPQGNSKLVNKVDCRLSYDSFLALCSRQQCRPSLLQNPLQRDPQRTPAI